MKTSELVTLVTNLCPNDFVYEDNENKGFINVIFGITHNAPYLLERSPLWVVFNAAGFGNIGFKLGVKKTCGSDEELIKHRKVLESLNLLDRFTGGLLSKSLHDTSVYSILNKRVLYALNWHNTQKFWEMIDREI